MSKYFFLYILSALQKKVEKDKNTYLFILAVNYYFNAGKELRNFNVRWLKNCFLENI